MASDGGTNRPLPSLILLGIVDFVCILMGAESYRDRQFAAGSAWILAGIVSSLIGYYWPQIKLWSSKSPPPSPPKQSTPTNDKPPTLLDLFKKDFNLMKASDQEDAYTMHSPDGSAVKIKRQTYMDFDAKTKFVGFYIPTPSPPSTDCSGEKTVIACMELLRIDAVKETFADFEKQVTVLGGRGDQMTSLRDLTFSGRVMIYHEEFLSIPHKAEILKSYEAKGLSITFRGTDYLGTQVIAWHRQHDTKGTRT